MCYTTFTARQIEKDLNIKFAAQKLFDKVNTIIPTVWLLEAVERAKTLGLNSEKSRSERLINPVLSELAILNPQQITIYSGMNLEGDSKLGLNGECDFVLSFSLIPDFIKSPIFSIVEAKKNDIEAGTIQCAAQLVAALMVNKEEKPDFDQPIFGCSCTGTEWRFLKLEKNTITVDLDHYFLSNLPQLLGILQFILDTCRPK